MKFFKKTIVIGIIFLLGIVLTYNFYIQHSNKYSTIELTSENNTLSNIICSDSEIYEEDQNCNSIVFLSVVVILSKHKYFYGISRLTLPFYTIWQPPKLS